MNRRTFLTGLALTPLAGCNRSPSSGGFSLVIGQHGHTSGRFYKPRGIEVFAPERRLYVVDWDGRIQSFDFDGTFRSSWIMPEVKNGKPEDLCFAPDGHLLVADTHYHRILEFDLTGKVIGHFGSYGREPGQFIYPVGICCTADGDILVSEYGENDRIQRFARDGTFRTEWGHFGRDNGGFQRPSGLALAPDQASVWVADTVNHCIRGFDLEGKRLGVIGSEGAEAGSLRYPHDVVVTEDSLYVCEFGNQRIQRFDRDGTPRGTFGTPGRGDGQFSNPWRFTLFEDRLYISDTGNHRVVVTEAF